MLVAALAAGLLLARDHRAYADNVVEGMSRPLVMLMEELGPQALLFGSHFDVKWVAPVRAGGSVEPRARVRDSGAARLLLELEVLCGGATAMVGSAAIPLALPARAGRSGFDHSHCQIP